MDSKTVDTLIIGAGINFFNSSGLVEARAFVPDLFHGHAKS